MNTMKFVVMVMMATISFTSTFAAQIIVRSAPQCTPDQLEAFEAEVEAYQAEIKAYRDKAKTLRQLCASGMEKVSDCATAGLGGKRTLEKSESCQTIGFKAQVVCHKSIEMKLYSKAPSEPTLYGSQRCCRTTGMKEGCLSGKRSLLQPKVEWFH